MAATCRVRDVAVDEPTRIGTRRASRATFVERHSDREPKSASSANPQAQGQISTNDLYPALDVGTGDLARALPRLEIASDHLQDAISAHENGDLVGADLSVLRLNGVLAGLFLSRGLGDGFGALVNALLSSLENLNGLPMSLDQIRACKRVIGVLRGEPYIDFSSATTQMDILEDVGLSIEPAGYEYIADWLDG